MQNNRIAAILSFFKREIVLTISLLLAAASAFQIPPDGQYPDYIDFRTLAILFCLMAVMAGLRDCGAFRFAAEKLLARVKSVRMAALMLMLLCFFGSMLITNDVALITFVPFTFIVFSMMLPGRNEKFTLAVVVLETVAANLGSMLTPIGNPQNLYLYGMGGFSLGEFLLLMLPYAAASLLLVILATVLIRIPQSPVIAVMARSGTGLPTGRVALHLALFFVSLLSVSRLLPWPIALAVTVVALLIWDRRAILGADYTLLLTFAALFVFIGNLGRIPQFSEAIRRVIAGNEVVTSALASQVMSNVPAAVLLSGFTDKYDALIIGTNLGGLGTLIASMASLISFKFVGREAKNLRGWYLLRFTVVNVAFLAVLLLMWRLLN